MQVWSVETIVHYIGLGVLATVSAMLARQYQNVLSITKAKQKYSKLVKKNSKPMKHC